MQSASDHFAESDDRRYYFTFWFLFLCTRIPSVVRSLFSSIIVVVESLDNHNVVDFDHDDHDDEYDNHVLLADSTWRPSTRALATRLSSWRARSSSQSTISNTIILVNTPLLVQQYRHVITFLLL